MASLDAACAARTPTADSLETALPLGPAAPSCSASSRYEESEPSWDSLCTSSSDSEVSAPGAKGPAAAAAAEHRRRRLGALAARVVRPRARELEDTSDDDDGDWGQKDKEDAVDRVAFLARALALGPSRRGAEAVAPSLPAERAKAEVNRDFFSALPAATDARRTGWIPDGDGELDEEDEQAVLCILDGARRLALTT